MDIFGTPHWVVYGPDDHYPHAPVPVYTTPHDACSYLPAASRFFLTVGSSTDLTTGAADNCWTDILADDHVHLLG